MSAARLAVVLTGLLAAALVALVVPPRHYVASGGVVLSPEAFCTRTILDAPPSPDAVGRGIYTGSNPKGPRYDRCIEQASTDAPLLAVYLAGILAGTALLAWAVTPRASTTRRVLEAP